MSTTANGALKIVTTPPPINIMPTMSKPNGLVRQPRLLWANQYCLLDTSSGASISVRLMLKQLAAAGFEIDVYGNTVFDHENGIVGLQDHQKLLQSHQGRMIRIQDDLLEHRLHVTASTDRDCISSQELAKWYFGYEKTLDEFKPDILFYYGGHPIDFLTAAEAKARGIPVVFYLVNGNYKNQRWARDVDLILTDSKATASLYEKRLGRKVTPVGTPIDPHDVLVESNTRERILFVNPSVSKGALLVARIALLMEKSRPDIMFEVVESRGSWEAIVAAVTAGEETARNSLGNVIVTPHTRDMRPIYSRTRLLLAPSLWWESAARVIVEAMLNGIPAVITDNGGMPEMMQDGGITIKLSQEYHEAPFNKTPSDAALMPVIERIEALFDDQKAYAVLVEKAYRVGREHHALSISTQRLVTALKPLVTRQVEGGIKV